VDAIPAQRLVRELHRLDYHFVDVLIAVELGARFGIGMKPKRGRHGIFASTANAILGTDAVAGLQEK
jgi:hypothetical protein